ncbi:hypothetical protein BVC80_1127g8 [Macleaya cordata]|uniref:Integrase catalytic domain-containing protein n=1 Tax=Macleaya cordata TaxID=56857 RepID=A0A200Q6N7_MACCD|nr:hypothetical protein BVC80_1127g8 [Macleaya cordata]
MPKALGGHRLLLVGTNYFTKWEEAVLLVQIMEHNVRRFVWEQSICRFGLPMAIIADNGMQFKGAKLKDSCKQYKIQRRSQNYTKNAF